ncbi:GNAT family N-acetyltransferase [Aliagarivorans taiwanensis]|uniref:GNAT family N-acetyltransferase n=1 Tax=Aliagarivorans taiwanensis TaxID=561966 RepID=UPI000417ED32|nr:GNAT family N-acetyltransferase [Aliagarivorans taiwanensis]
MKFEYRPAQNYQLAQRLVRLNMKNYYTQQQVEWNAQAFVDSWQDCENYELLVDGQVVGVVRWQAQGDDWYIRDLQVAEDFQNQGLGSWALEALIEEAQAEGIHNLRLRVFRGCRAQELYQRFGFEVTLPGDVVLTMKRCLTH